MRLVRVGNDASQVGADVRVALTALGRQDSVVGGIALTGVRLAHCPRPIDAVAVLPHGVLIIVGVELPDPALRLEAPMAGQWKTDGWPLARSDGTMNPAVEALQLVNTVAARLQAAGLTSVPVRTVIAVGPYVETVSQPPDDVARGVRVVHPSATNLLALTAELATSTPSCSVEHAQRLLRELAPEQQALPTTTLLGEGFADTISPELASADTKLLPRFDDASPGPLAAQNAPSNPSSSTPRWLPIGALALVGLLVLIGIVVALSTSGSNRDEGTGQGQRRSGAKPVTPVAVEVGGVSFARTATKQDNTCAPHAFGDLGATLQREDCTQLRRAEFQAKVRGRTAEVSVAVALFGDSRTANSFQQVAQVPGSGGIKALNPGDPSAERIPRGAAFGTASRDNRVRIIQVAWRGQPSTPDDRDLIKLVQSARELPMPG
ncbi:MAG: hypothetical protein GEU98_23720 [Pseudonocardiaceae bacterium]|nr:hypothetical protein [Pseudonocardiaceae bacterium]